MEKGYTLVTASNRIAHHLKYQYAHQQLTAGKRAWESVDVLPWQSWLHRCWEACYFHQSDYLLLAPVQELALWQQAIDQSHQADKLLQTSTIARRAAEAWSLLCQYHVPVFPDDVYISEDAYAFRFWADKFRQTCRENGWLDNARLPDVLIDYVDKQANVFGKKIVFIGFEELTPQQRALYRALEAAGNDVVKFQVSDKQARKNNGTIKLAGFQDTASEIRAAAVWSRDLLGNDKETSIGIIVPNLNVLRRQLAYGFEDVLSPGTLVSEQKQNHPFSLSLGQPLLDYPLINSMFALLALGSEPVAIADISHLLRSHFIKGAAAEGLKRAVFDACLRVHGEVSLTLKSLLVLADRELQEEERPVLFLEMLEQARAYFEALSGQQTPYAWATHITKISSLFSWPGDRTATSDEYQLIQQWQRTLEQFVSLQLVLPKMSYSMAVSHLRRIAMEFNFQPETEETPIQILGASGAAEMAFDHLWIMGMHEEEWPPAARPNPFIPMALQKKYQLPHATADISLSYAQELLSGLVHSSADVVLSYPQNENERELRPSPLLREFKSNSESIASVGEDDYLQQIHATQNMESLNDNRAPVIAAGEHSAGGAALFKDQSTCPFRAFARHRLHAQTLDSVDIGLDARERGSILHGVLQVLWQRLESQQRLISLSTNDLDALLEEIIHKSINSFQQKHPQSFSKRFTQLEKQRLKKILLEWLEIEKERAPFSVIATEQRQQISFEGLQVRTQIDRIDQLEDKRQVIIDYKTGEAKVSDWAGQRPDDPQLTLYAVTQDKPVAALAFARLKQGKSFGYAGLAEDGDLIPKLKAFVDSREMKMYIDDDGVLPDWQELQDQWKEVLQDLAHGFRDGDARVDPKNPQACVYCDQHTFCRIYERLTTESTENTEE